MIEYINLKCLNKISKNLIIPRKSQFYETTFNNNVLRIIEAKINFHYFIKFGRS